MSETNLASSAATGDAPTTHLDGQTFEQRLDALEAGLQAEIAKHTARIGLIAELRAVSANLSAEAKGFWREFKAWL